MVFNQSNKGSKSNPIYMKDKKFVSGANTIISYLFLSLPNDTEVERGIDKVPLFVSKNEHKQFKDGY